MATWKKAKIDKNFNLSQLKDKNRKLKIVEKSWQIKRLENIYWSILRIFYWVEIFGIEDKKNL